MNTVLWTAQALLALIFFFFRSLLLSHDPRDDPSGARSQILRYLNHDHPATGIAILVLKQQNSASYKASSAMLPSCAT